MNYAVWAPLARQVRLSLGDHFLEMVEGGGGWWTTRQPITPNVLPYGYLLDDATVALPDPRSRRQPDGVHARSAPHYPNAFRWTDENWRGRHLAGGVVYELHIGTFTAAGTLDAAIERLPHLVDLGIDFVELLPVNAFNGTHNWGYDGVFWFAVHEAYGGPEAYQRFVDACHRHGLAVIQDVVYNHLGPSGNYLPRFGPYLHQQSSNTWGSSINLDEPEVRRYILDNAAMWAREYHVDGLRLDAVHALVDTSPTHILRELAASATELSAELGRPFTLIAESDLNDPTMITPIPDGGHGIDAQWSDDFHHAVHVALTGETTGYYADFASPNALGKVMTRGFFHDGTYSSFRGRDHGRPIDITTTPAWRLVVASQNHDQIGNRAAGDRLSATLDDGRLAIAALLTLTSPFTPMLFMGEEWAASTPWQFFTSHPEPELATATAAGRIEEFARMGWDPAAVPDPQAMSTFLDSKLDWRELETDRHRGMLDVYRALVECRRNHPELRDPDLGRVAVEREGDGGVIVIRRGDAIVIAVNLTADDVSLECPGAIIFSTTPVTNTDGGPLRLAGHSAAIVRREDHATAARTAV